MYEKYLLSFWTSQLHINPKECPDLWGENCNGQRKKNFNKIEKKNMMYLQLFEFVCYSYSIWKLFAILTAYENCLLFLQHMKIVCYSYSIWKIVCFSYSIWKLFAFLTAYENCLLFLQHMKIVCYSYSIWKLFAFLTAYENCLLFLQHMKIVCYSYSIWKLLLFLPPCAVFIFTTAAGPLPTSLMACIVIIYEV